MPGVFPAQMEPGGRPVALGAMYTRSPGIGCLKANGWYDVIDGIGDVA